MVLVATPGIVLIQAKVQRPDAKNPNHQGKWSGITRDQPGEANLNFARSGRQASLRRALAQFINTS